MLDDLSFKVIFLLIWNFYSKMEWIKMKCCIEQKPYITEHVFIV